MLVVKIHQGKYYTSYNRLVKSFNEGAIKKVTKEGKEYFCTLKGELICPDNPQLGVSIEIPPSINIKD